MKITPTAKRATEVRRTEIVGERYSDGTGVYQLVDVTIRTAVPWPFGTLGIVPTAGETLWVEWPQPADET